MASKGINKVIVLGNLGQDPEIKFLPSGGAVANVSVATSESWKDKQTGEQKDKTEWHRVVVFGKLAEIVGEYLKKGSQVYFEGKLQTRKWQDQSGQDRYTTEIVVDGFDGKMQMLGGNGASGHPQAERQQNMQQPQQTQQPQMYSQQQHAPQQNMQQQIQQAQQMPQQQAQQQAQQQVNQQQSGFYQPPQGQAQQPAHNEPPMDFDNDIPF